MHFFRSSSSAYTFHSVRTLCNIYYIYISSNRTDEQECFLSVFFPPSHARLEEGKCIRWHGLGGKKPLHYTIHNTYMRIVPRGGGAYTRPRIIQIDLPRPLVISIRRRRITLPLCAGRGNAGDTIIRSSLSFAPSFSHSPERPRIRVAHTHAQTTRSILYVYVRKHRIYILYYVHIIIIIENPSYNPFSRTHTYTHT